MVAANFLYYRLGASVAVNKFPMHTWIAGFILLHQLFWTFDAHQAGIRNIHCQFIFRDYGGY
jgi:hypothetical protein